MGGVEGEWVGVKPVDEGFEPLGIGFIPLVEFFRGRRAEEEIVVGFPMSGIDYFFWNGSRYMALP